ncbi:hypothetical protein T265_10353 [Opisthorchis viverrini]|uniref:Uncharacterized protein n=1 Tax=Opisthorchis viverrini TaxID=6198 RepID=A0A075A1M4_OPIVI|nr:hypothetical protein T265_10353 [Opisthorchis viverrini]KER21294.1 hypothetical protein T265_10353 [Opisthorchis viverrini]
MRKNSAIYRIPCKDCDKRYIGQQDGSSPQEHMNISSLQKDTINFLSSPCTQITHEFDWSDARTLAEAGANNLREFMEACYSTEEAINKHIGIDPICRPGGARKHKKTTVSQGDKSAVVRELDTPLPYSMLVPVLRLQRSEESGGLEFGRDTKIGITLVRRRICYRHGREFLELWYSTADLINRCIEMDPIYARLPAKKPTSQPEHSRRTEYWMHKQRNQELLGSHAGDRKDKGYSSIEQITTAGDAKLKVHVGIGELEHRITEQPMEPPDRTTNRDQRSSPASSTYINTHVTLLNAQAQTHRYVPLRSPITH